VSDTLDTWAVIELLGHRRLAGRVTETQIAGHGFLRLDIPSDPAVTQYVAPGSVYALTPTTEEIARTFARRARPEPIQRWELEPPRAYEQVSYGQEGVGEDGPF
jgi:hypothetical protein